MFSPINDFGNCAISNTCVRISCLTYYWPSTLEVWPQHSLKLNNYLQQKKVTLEEKGGRNEFGIRWRQAMFPSHKLCGPTRSCFTRCSFIRQNSRKMTLTLTVYIIIFNEIVLLVRNPSGRFLNPPPQTNHENQNRFCARWVMCKDLYYLKCCWN